MVAMSEKKEGDCRQQGGERKTQQKVETVERY